MRTRSKERIKWSRERLRLRLFALRYTWAITPDRYFYLRDVVLRSKSDPLDQELIQHLVGEIPTRTDRFIARHCAQRGALAIPRETRSRVRQAIAEAPDRSGLWANIESAAIVRFAGLVQLLAVITVGVGVFGIVTAQVNIHDHSLALWVTLGSCVILSVAVILGVHVNAASTTAIEVKARTTLHNMAPLLNGQELTFPGGDAAGR